LAFVGSWDRFFKGLRGGRREKTSGRETLRKKKQKKKKKKRPPVLSWGDPKHFFPGPRRYKTRRNRGGGAQPAGTPIFTTQGMGMAEWTPKGPKKEKKGPGARAILGGGGSGGPGAMGHFCFPARKKGAGAPRYFVRPAIVRGTQKGRGRREGLFLKKKIGFFGRGAATNRNINSGLKGGQGQRGRPLLSGPTPTGRGRFPAPTKKQLGFLSKGGKIPYNSRRMIRNFGKKPKKLFHRKCLRKLGRWKGQAAAKGRKKMKSGKKKKARRAGKKPDFGRKIAPKPFGWAGQSRGH